MHSGVSSRLRAGSIGSAADSPRCRAPTPKRAWMRSTVTVRRTAIRLWPSGRRAGVASFNQEQRDRLFQARHKLFFTLATMKLTASSR